MQPAPPYRSGKEMPHGLPVANSQTMPGYRRINPQYVRALLLIAPSWYAVAYAVQSIGFARSSPVLSVRPLREVARVPYRRKQGYAPLAAPSLVSFIRFHRVLCIEKAQPARFPIIARSSGNLPPSIHGSCLFTTCRAKYKRAPSEPFDLS